MKKANHFLDYSLLLIAGLLFLVFLGLNPGNRTAGLTAIFVFTVFYVVWAIYHHLRSGTFHPRNVLEYLLIGLTVAVATRIIFSF